MVVTDFGKTVGNCTPCGAIFINTVKETNGTNNLVSASFKMAPLGDKKEGIKRRGIKGAKGDEG